MDGEIIVVDQTPQRRTYSNPAGILIGVTSFLGCVTPRFIGFMKINVGFNLSFYSIFVAICWVLLKLPRKQKIHTHYTYKFMFILFTASLLNIFNFIEFDAWIQYLFYILISILFMQVLVYNEYQVPFNYVYPAINLATIIHAFIGIIEIVTHNYFFEVGTFSWKLYGDVPVSIFFNPNDYSMYMATMLPILIYSYMNKKNTFMKIFYLVMISIIVYLLIVAMSRAAMLAIALSAIVLSLHVIKQIRWKNFIIALSIIALPLIFLVPTINSTITDFASQNFVDMTTKSDIYRMNLLKNGLSFLETTKGLGVGAGNLKYWLGNQAIYPIENLIYMHNWYAELLVTFGVVIFVAYMVYHVSSFAKLYAFSKMNSTLKSPHIYMFISFIMFSITCISSSSNVYSEWVWMYFALITAFIHKNIGNTDTNIKNKAKPTL